MVLIFRLSIDQLLTQVSLGVPPASLQLSSNWLPVWGMVCTILYQLVPLGRWLLQGLGSAISCAWLPAGLNAEPFPNQLG